MPILSPSELKSLCAKYHLNPSKQYGQNYLISTAPIKKMIEAAELSPDDIVVEIGPGFGILTFSLAPRVKKVVAFEIEKKLMPFWKEKQKEFPNVEIIWGNVLNLANSSEPIANSPYKVVANIPYQITSHLLRTLFELKNKPERIIIMVQKEVAERICAKPRSAGSRQAGTMSMLAVSVQYYGTPQIITKVSKGNFWPSPAVDSAVLLISNLSRVGRVSRLSKIGDWTDEEFFRVVKAGFTNKRKQLWRNLSGHLQLEKEAVKNIIKEVTGNEKIRAEDLSVDDWKKIVEKIVTPSPSP